MTLPFFFLHTDTGHSSHLQIGTLKLYIIREGKYNLQSFFFVSLNAQKAPQFTKSSQHALKPCLAYNKSVRIISSDTWLMSDELEL